MVKVKICEDTVGILYIDLDSERWESRDIMICIYIYNNSNNNNTIIIITIIIIRVIIIIISVRVSGFS